LVGRSRVYGKLVESFVLIHSPVDSSCFSSTETGVKSIASLPQRHCVPFTRKARRFKLSLLLACFLFFFLAANAWAVDPSRRISQYAHSTWRIQDGSFSGAPNAITQTADGYLWIGTLHGLVRFDGVRFVPWVPPDGESLPTGIFSLLAASDGSLWIGTGHHLAHWKDGVLVNYMDHLGRINAILEDRNGTVWVTRSRVNDPTGPLCQVAGAKLLCHGQAEGIKSPYAGPMVSDSEGNIWIGSSDVLTRWQTGSSDTYVNSALKSAQGLSGLQALAATPAGSLWIGIGRHGAGLGLQQFVQGVWKPFAIPKLNGNTLEVTALFLDRENSLWIGTTDQGVYRLSDGKVDRFFSADGLSSDSVSGFYEDREGNLWVATSEGIDCFRDIPVVSFSIREGLSANLVESVLADRDNNVWIGNHGALDSLHDGNLTSIKRANGLPGERVTSLLEDHAGQLWVGVDNGLSVFEQGKFIPIKRRDGSPIGTIIALSEDRDDNIWAEAIGNPARLVRIHNRSVLEEIPAPQIPVANSIAADPQDGIWLGLANGDLARYRHGKLETVFVNHGQNSAVRQVLVNPDGSVLGATSAGLIGWQHGKLRTLTVQNGLRCDSVYGLISDSDHALWLYTACGLVQVSNLEMHKWWEHAHAVVQTRIFDVFDGARPSLGSFQPRVSRSPDGRLWFTNTNVVQMVDPAHLSGNVIPPPVRVEAIVADRKSYSFGGNLRLPPLARDLEIDYTALSFVAPQKVRFRYKLEGRDTAWQEPGTRRQAFYSDLRPGKYRFRVIACNNDGVWNTEGASLDFSVAPAWYQTNSFRVLCLAAFCLIAWTIYRLRVRQIAKAISARFDERMHERTRMARDLHDTFLQTIQGSKLVADDALDRSTDPVRMRRAMEQLSAWLGRATEEGRAALNSLRTSTTETNDLAAAFRRAMEECRIHSSMETSLSVAGGARETHPIVRDEIYRIGYEAIRNACVHSQANQLRVELAYGHDLALRISDNGVGVGPAIADGGKEGHFGLQGMRERAVRIAGKLTIVSTANSGTEIKLVVPGGIIYRKTTSTSQSLPAKIKSLFKSDGSDLEPN
jgi:signal transduction histidine kinase/ligand-binding sensor domain-containing protein